MTALKMLLGSMGTMALVCLAMPAVAQLPDDLRRFRRCACLRLEHQGSQVIDHQPLQGPAVGGDRAG